MRTITIDIINEKVLHILKDLELLNLIRLRKEKRPRKTNPLSQLKGAMSKQKLNDIDQQLNDLRNEWE